MNQVGGNDELVFDGGSFVTGADGHVIRQLVFAEADLGLWDTRDAVAAEEHLAIGAGDEAAAVEHQFVVTAHLIHIRHRALQSAGRGGG